MRKYLVYFYLFLFFSFAFFSSGVIDSHDGFLYLAVARNIYYTGEPTAPVYEYDSRKNVHLSAFVGANGKTYTVTGLGFSLAFLPAVVMTDVIYKLFQVNPPVYFPLESDWLIFLTASFTNAFLGALFGVVLFLYLIKTSLKPKQALFITFTALFATNLWVYTKHSLAHMMFVTFLLTSFYFIKLYATAKQKKFLVFSGLAFGITAITYNQTFLLTVIPLALYYFLLVKKRLSLNLIKNAALDFALFLIGMLPFIVIYIWFENLRSLPATSNLVQSYSNYLLSYFPVTVIFEGLWGQLLSPGRSIFLYSPILLIIAFFWHKIEKKIFPEACVFFLTSLIYISFYSTAFSIGRGDQGIAGLWHGESSWGPRYLIPLLPFAILVIGNIYTNISNRARILVFYPLIALGLFVQLLGIILPYQTKLFDMQDKFLVNQTEYTNHVYTNLLPRYSPLITMSKNLVKLFINFPKINDHGIYNVKLYDGVDFPFNVGPERWRTIQGKGYISFDNYSKDPVKKITFGLINHPVAESSSSAKIDFLLNDQPLLEKPLVLDVTQREIVNLQIANEALKEKGNLLLIRVKYDDQKILEKNKQILGMISFSINNHVINTETLDFPYVSPLGPAMLGIKYQNYGGDNQDPWKTWDIHTQMFERFPDFWWVRNLYYWDIPKQVIYALFVVNVLGVIILGQKVIRGIAKFKS